MISDEEEIRRAEFLLRYLSECRSRDVAVEQGIKDRLVAWTHDILDWLPDEQPPSPPNNDVGFRRRAAFAAAFRTADRLDLHLPAEIIVRMVAWAWPAPRGGWRGSKRPRRNKRGKPH